MVDVSSQINGLTLKLTTFFVQICLPAIDCVYVAGSCRRNYVFCIVSVASGYVWSYLVACNGPWLAGYIVEISRTAAVFPSFCIIGCVLQWIYVLCN